MRFHPLEDSFLIDPADWFADAVITAPEELLAGAAGKTCSDTTSTCTVPATAWRDLQDTPEWCAPARNTRRASTGISSVRLQQPAVRRLQSVCFGGVAEPPPPRTYHA